MARFRRAASTPSSCPARVVLLAAVWLGAHAAAAGDAPSGSILSPREHEVLTAGASHVVRWSPIPAEVDEFEILLSLDGGSSYPVRLTPQLDPATRAYLWRVPDLPARSARLRLRWGIAGHELDGPPGPSFTVDARTWRTATGLTWRGGEWWLTSHPSLVGLRPETTHWRHDLSPADPTPRFAPAQGSRWDPCPSAGPIRNAATIAELADATVHDRSGSRRPVSFPMRC